MVVALCNSGQSTSLGVLVFCGEYVFINVVIKINAMLRAKTVTTGAKMTDKILPNLNDFPKVSPKNLPSHHISISKLSLRTINGDMAISTQRNKILIMSTAAKATKGKNKATAMPTLIIISQEILPIDQTDTSEISAKLSIEE
ncbi:MAG: hypothetical protein WCG98_08480 [bacterium]